MSEQWAYTWVNLQRLHARKSSFDCPKPMSKRTDWLINEPHLKVRQNSIDPLMLLIYYRKEVK